jgi:hypothetical protein
VSERTVTVEVPLQWSDMMSDDFEMNRRGFCRLCGNEAVLVDGHIWPKFAYKRYISDLTKGGSFIALERNGGRTSIEKEGVILLQLGPMFIFSILSRAGMSLRDVKMWEASLLSENGGVISPVQEWRVGKNIRLPAARLLATHEFWVKKTVLETMS